MAERQGERRQRTGAEETVALIENSGLDYKRDKRASVALDSKIGHTLQKVIRSEAGVNAMLAAMDKGLPPLAGADPLLRAALGSDYCEENETTVQAGYVVTGMMEGLGYQKTDSTLPLPPECIARSGALFTKKGRGG